MNRGLLLVLLALGQFPVSACDSDRDDDDVTDDDDSSDEDDWACGSQNTVDACEGSLEIPSSLDPSQPLCPSFWAGLVAGQDDWQLINTQFASLQVSDLTPATAVDYLELRGPLQQVVSSTGTRCANAPDFDACEQAFADLALEYGFPEGTGMDYEPAYSLVWTRAGEVGSIGSSTALVAFLGSLETTTDALFLVAAHGYDWRPLSPFDLTGALGPVGEAMLRSTADGFEVISFRWVAWEGLRRDVVKLELAVDGTLSLEDQAIHLLNCGVTIG